MLFYVPSRTYQPWISPMNALPPPLIMRGPNLRIALLLGVAGILATLALMPYALALMPQKFAASPMPLPLVMAATAAQTGVVCWLVGWLGLYLGAPNGLDAPWLRAWVYRRPRDPRRRARWGLAIWLGVLAAALTAGLSLLGPTLSPGGTTTAAGWAWRGALASFYGGIVEETQLRLLCVSLFVWLLAWTNRKVARPWMFMAAIVLAALLFGAGHLPALFAISSTPGPLLIGKIVLLNALSGVLFGALFWKYGLEHAMLAHFCGDMVLHVAVPLFTPG